MHFLQARAAVFSAAKRVHRGRGCCRSHFLLRKSRRVCTLRQGTQSREVFEHTEEEPKFFQIGAV